MSRKGCELCTNPARMFCDSDQASLCWDCDEKVHAANFLVAKHSRTLLCHACFSPTPWKAAGPSLGPTVSVCHACARHAQSQNTTESEGDGEADREYYSSETDDSSQEDEDEDDEDDEEGENQVVPWSASASDSAPAASSSGEEEEEDEECVSLSSKRSRDDAFASEEVSSFDACCSSRNAEMGSEEFDETNYDSLRFVRRRASGGGGPSSGTAAIVEKLRRFEQQIVAEESDASAMIVGICNLTTE